MIESKIEVNVPKLIEWINEKIEGYYAEMRDSATGMVQTIHDHADLLSKSLEESAGAPFNPKAGPKSKGVPNTILAQLYNTISKGTVDHTQAIAKLTKLRNFLEMSTVDTITMSFTELSSHGLVDE